MEAEKELDGNHNRRSSTDWNLEEGRFSIGQKKMENNLFKKK